MQQYADESTEFIIPQTQQLYKERLYASMCYFGLGYLGCLGTIVSLYLLVAITKYSCSWTLALLGASIINVVSLLMTALVKVSIGSGKLL